LRLGQSNDKLVVVEDGLTEGDLVIRSPRSAVAEARADMTADDIAELQARFSQGQSR
jgi:hypothetical protein